MVEFTMNSESGEEDAAVADCYPMCVTSKVMHHSFRSGK